MAQLVRIDCNIIVDWNSFHKEFKQAFGFPAFYGENMNAWIDCMTSLDAPEDGMSSINCEVGTVLTIELDGINEFKNRCPDQYAAIIESSAFVNWRRIKNGEESVLALSFYTEE